MLVALLLGLVAPLRAQDAVLPWFEGGRPGPLVQAALALLADAGSHGLEVRDYGLPALQQALQQADRQAAALAPDQGMALQRALTAALLRYLQDLHDGRVVPGTLGGLPMQRDHFDAAAALRAAIASRDLPQAVRAAVPALPQYERLREALSRYRALSGHAAWSQPWPALPRSPGRPQRVLEPGQPWAGLPLLAARLVALGDLDAPADGAALATVYDAALVAAVQAFQRRHGLEPDGLVGRATAEALQVMPAQRVRQLELTLERLRWTPLRRGPRMIVVNIPEFVLRAYELHDDRVVVHAQMKVVVGRALDSRTPLIVEDLRAIEFGPYWNVPASIARKELVPRLRRDPAYWTREGFEFVAAGVADPVLTEAKLQAVLDGAMRIRQRPGPHNALGAIKFVFPNRQAIYLHHTPATQLFEQARRDFSHGCIRVEQPLALAAFALQGQAGWSPQRIRAAMAQGQPPVVTLAQPVPVLISYGTALVKAGRVHFFGDVYGHDRVLERALRDRARPPLSVPALTRP